MRLTNIAWSICGLGGPLVVAFLTIPALIEKIGMERFGLLALAWSLIGFAGVFDLGIGRATTQSIARFRGGNQLDQVPAVVRTATNLSFRTGFIAAIFLSVAIFAGVHTFIRFSIELKPQVTIAAYLLAFTIPIQSMSAMFRGINEAFDKFREVSLIRIGLGMANFLGPFCVATFTSNLAILVSTLLVSRLIAFFLYWQFSKFCLSRELPIGVRRVSAEESTEVVKQLLSFGGWFTISGLVSPVLVQMDRFLIGAMISASAVAIYTIPFDVVTQSLIIVSSISSVAFPSLSALVHSEPEKSNVIFRMWLFRVVVTMLIVSSTCALLLPVILPLWIGPTLPSESILVGQILCFGVFFNSIGSMYFALLHAYGRTDITAKIHIIELPIFLVLLYSLIANYGVVGAAVAWVGRMMFDSLLLWMAYRTYLPKNIYKKI